MHQHAETRVNYERIARISYLNEAVMEKEANGGGPRDRRLPEPQPGDRRHELVELRAGLGIVVGGELSVASGGGLG